MTIEGNRFGCKLDIFELGAVLECGIANSLEVFVADDALEGGAFVERLLLDDFELIGESDTSEGGIVLECAMADSPEFFVEVDALEGRAMQKSTMFDDCEHIGKGDTREGGAMGKCEPS